jgi:predicted RNA binding protein YcfA (HicA-like mRNA interferase family)
MSHLTPQRYQDLIRVFKKDGFVIDRQEGSHIVMTKPGIPRPLVVPTYKNVGEDIILSLLRTAKMSRERYLSLLKE